MQRSGIRRNRRRARIKEAENAAVNVPPTRLVETFCGTAYFKDRDGTDMTVVLDSKFATAEDAAKILGVPKTRVKWLKRLAEARTISSTRNGKGSALKVERKKAEPVKRKYAGGKGKKAAR